MTHDEIFAKVRDVLVDALAVDEDEVTPEPARPTPLPAGDTDRRGAIRFEDVTFGYGDEPVLRDVSFDIAAGEKVAFVGATGSGKSTILKLLTRLYDVDAGRITVDGVDVRDLALAELRDAVGIVPQDVFLFAGDILENIRLGHPEISDADAEAAARAAEAAEDALELADNADYATAAARAVERGDENSPTVFPVGFQVSALKELTLQQLAHELFARSMSVPSLVAKQHKLTPAEEDKSRATMTKALTFVVSRELEKARRNRADLRRKRREAREERAQQLRKVCHSLRAASRVLTVRHVVLRIVRHSRSSTPPKNARSDVGARSYHSASSPSQPALLTPCASRIADWCLRLGTTAGDSSVRPHGKVKWWTICVRGMCDM